MSSIRRGGILLGAVLAVLLAIAPDARADRATELKAREAFAAGRFDQALELFAKLYAETLHPVYLRNIGRCHQKMREPQKAIDAFRDYLAKEKKMPADERAEINGYITEMEALKAEQAKQAQPAPPPPPTVTPVQPLPPANPPTVTATTTPPPAVQPGPPTTATLVAQPAPRDDDGGVLTKWWFWTGVGVVVVGAVVATVILASGTNRPTCPTDVKCSP